MTPPRAFLQDLDRPTSRATVLFAWMAALGVVLVFVVRSTQVLDAVVDPFGSQVPLMRTALRAYVLYGSGVFSLLLLTPVLLFRRGHRVAWLPAALVVVGGSLLVAGAYVDTVVFRDYGIHAYEYDFSDLFISASTLGDLGIRRQDLLAAAAGVGLILLAAVGVFAGLHRLAPRAPRGTGPVAALLLPVVSLGGLAAFGTLQARISEDRHDFLSTLPARRLLLPGSADRPHVAVAPRLGPGGYPDPRDPATPIPELPDRKNVVLVLGDGLRGDHVADSAGLTPNLAAFAAHPSVIRSRRHHSTGPFTDMGVYGLTYGLDTYTYFAFMEDRVPSYPLEVFRRNGYRLAILTASRLLQFPTSQVLDNFDERVQTDEDIPVYEAARRFVEARRRDGAPYLLVVFYYAPHWPFVDIAEENRVDRPDMDDVERSAFADMDDPAFRARARNGYRNGVRQFDTWFGRTFDLVRDDFEAGRTVVGVTADHGTELWEHGMLGQGRSTFWNEKILVPFLLGLPGASLTPEQREPTMTSHVDLLPTLFQYLGATPLPAPETYSTGRSLLATPEPPTERTLVLTGRYFPWADRMNAMVTSSRKVWFSVTPGSDGDGFTVVPARVMDARDSLLDAEPPLLDADEVALIERAFWRFLRPAR
ncbi:MAG: hypothetical protein AMXMBFR53_19940 [Gemmatimonadota bacterium]